MLTGPIHAADLGCMLVTSEAKRFRSTTSSRGRKAQPDKQHNPCPTENHQRGITDLGLEPETHTISAVGCAAITYARPAVMPLRLAAIGLSSQPFLTAHPSTQQTMLTQSPKRRLSNVTWTSNQAPTKTQRKAAGLWTHGRDTAIPAAGRKVGKHLR